MVTYMRNIEQPVIVILVARDPVGGEVAVIDPDVGRVLDLDQVFALGRVVEVEVAQDHVGLLLDAEPPVGQACEETTRQSEKDRQA